MNALADDLKVTVFFQPERTRTGGKWVAIFKRGRTARHVPMPEARDEAEARAFADRLLAGASR